MMKKFVLFIVWVIFISCEIEYTVKIKYVIANNTNKKITIKAFFDSKLYDTIDIKSGSYFEKKGEIEGRNIDLHLFDNKFNGGVRDSIVVIFDDKVYKVQYCETRKPVYQCENLENNLGIGTGLPYPAFGLKKRFFSNNYKYPRYIVFYNAYFDDALPLNK
jgi:hypothetical protein